jgi:hypothetical protein
VPYVLEIVSNKERLKKHKTTLGRQKLIIRKPKCKITTENVKILMIWELANRFEFEDESKDAVTDYLRRNKIGIKDLLKYAEHYPAKTLKNMREVLYELA